MHTLEKTFHKTTQNKWGTRKQTLGQITTHPDLLKIISISIILSFFFFTSRFYIYTAAEVLPPLQSHMAVTQSKPTGYSFFLCGLKREKAVRKKRESDIVGARPAKQ